VITFTDYPIENLTVRHKVTTIRDLKSLLSDIAPLVKEPRHLYEGRDIPNFRQRPREILANCLICIVGNFEEGQDEWTFGLDPMGGDGVIIKRSTGVGWPTEHVFVSRENSKQRESLENLMIKAVEHKHRKGEAYAEGNNLVIFADVDGGLWCPNRVGKRIEGKHGFDSVWAGGLEQADGEVYAYWVVRIDELQSQVWKVYVDFEKIEWNVEPIQR